MSVNLKSTYYKYLISSHKQQREVSSSGILSLFILLVYRHLNTGIRPPHPPSLIASSVSCHPPLTPHFVITFPNPSFASVSFPPPSLC